MHFGWYLILVSRQMLDFPISLISLKSFGDFIIARWALQKLGSAASGTSIIIGHHLCELDFALGRYPRTYCIRHGEKGVPAIFDIKQLGRWRGMRSALQIRRLISELNLPHKSTLIFDRKGFREKFVAATYPCSALPPEANIYLAYQKLFCSNASVESKSMQSGRSAQIKSVGIFPGSRISTKTMPDKLITSLLDACVRQGIRPTVFILDGESPNLVPPSGELLSIVPRRFDAMRNAVCSTDAVISADSMPAHMAEYFGKPIFVMSPVKNEYWLPLSCFLGNRWELFDVFSSNSSKLSSFLA